VYFKLIADATRGRIQLTLDRPAGQALLVATSKLARKRGFGALALQIDHALGKKD
jgi:hypothetical protein